MFALGFFVVLIFCHTILYYFQYCKKINLVNQKHFNKKTKKIVNSCKFLHQPFYPSFWATNKHIQTCIGELPRILPWKYNLKWTREIIPDEIGKGEITIDWLTHEGKDLTKDAPVVILFPGVSGGIISSYIRQLASDMKMKNLKVVCVTFRGCGDTKLKSLRFNNGHDIQDLRKVVDYVWEKCSKDTNYFFGIGISMGANLIMNYLGKTAPKDMKLTAGISLCNPVDFPASSVVLESWFNRMVYSRILCIGIADMMKKNWDAFKPRENDSTHNEILKKLDLQKLEKITTIREFDDTFTRIIGKGWKSVDDYYEDASCLPYLDKVSVPTLLLNARDDPFVDSSVLTARNFKNPNLILALTEIGGHIGFLRGWFPWFPAIVDPVKNDSFIGDVVIDFIHSVVENKTSQ